MVVNNEKELIYNLNTILCLPKEYESKVELYEHNFKYVYMFESNYKSADDFVQFVLTNNIKEVILVDYRLEYEPVIDQLSKEVEIGMLFTMDLASLSSEYFLIQHNAMINLYKNEKIKKLGLLDKNLFEITKKQFENTYYILLDEPVKNNNISDKQLGVGLLNISDDPKHSYFNELSALCLLNRPANLIKMSRDVQRFTKKFSLKVNEFENIDEIIKNSNITLYVNFCNSDTSVFLKSMDAGVPCIIGNNSIINENEYLKNKLQLLSDDDINEIAEKIEDVEKSKEEIFKEYQKFRKEYSEKSKTSIKEFLIAPVILREKKEYEKLLTVGIPVYNVEQYLAASIESVLNAITEDTEIIIVNDGSTDNSENVILKYQNKYPNLIRYIKQENHGLGNVRNVILKNSKGKYIASIDSDDTINKEFFKEAMPYLKKDIDIVLCDWLSIFKDSGKYPTEAQDNNLSFKSNYKKLLYSTIMPSTCNKIIKKELYEELDLKFIEGFKFEDLGTNPIIMNKIETIKYINKPYYEYNIRENSIMRTKVGYNMIDVLRILEDRVNKYINTPFNKEEFMAYVYFWRVEESILNQLYTLEEKERSEMIDYIYNNINDILEKLFINNKYVKEFIERVDKETRDYIIERNKKILLGKDELERFLVEKIDNKSYKILTPALILYNYDNRT